MKLTLLLILWCVAAPFVPSAFAQAIFPDTGNSIPDDETPPTTPRSREAGVKGMLYKFNVNSILNPAPLDLSGAQAFVKIGGAAAITCTATAAPAANQCGYQEASNIPLQLYYVEVFYNGLFPDNTVIEYWATGVKTNAASNPVSILQTAVNPPDHVHFLTSTVTRTPVSAAMVLDISGSMASNIVGGNGTRMSALQAASEVFLGLLNSLPPDPSDRTGAVFFSTTASPGAPMVAANDSLSVNNLKMNIDAKTPTNSTSIGDGLLKGQDLIKSTTPTSNAKTILLFSDGEQNCAPLVDGSLNISGAPCTGGANPAGDNAVLDATITVCPVTLGDLTTPGNKLMSDIGNSRCGGRNQHVLGTAAGPSLTLFFAQALESAFVGDKLETSKMISGTLSPSTIPAPESFTVNAKDLFLKIVLSWDTGQIQALPFQLQAPDGTMVDPTPFTVIGQNQNSVTSIAFPLSQGNTGVKKDGQWNIVFSAGTFHTQSVNYSGLVLLDNALLDSNFEAINPDAGTGETIHLSATLKEGSAPVRGATVIAQIVGPEQGIGDILSTQPTPAAPPPGTDQQTPAQAKLTALEMDPATQGLFLPQNFPAVTLFDDGMHHDGAANDGVYGADYSSTNDEGFYNFRFGVVATAPANGQFLRTYTQSVFVRAKPDPKLTTLTVVSMTPSAAGSVVLLRAIPKDRFNHFLGPDYIGSLTITSTAGTVQTPLADRLDGSYEISYLVPTGANPTIGLTILGTNVKQGLLHNLPGGGGGSLSFLRFEAGFDLGAAVPMGSFSNTADPSVSLLGVLDYRLNPVFSVGAYVGHDRFSLKAGGGDLYITHFSAQAKTTFSNGPTRPFAQAGLGLYVTGPGASPHFGWNIGTGLQHWFTPHLGLEGVYNFRQVDGGGSTRNYSTLQGGIRFAF